MQRELAAEGLNLVRVERNLVDAVWEDRPVLELAPVFPLGLRFAGQSVEDKLAAVQRKMAARGAASLVLTALDEVAWLFNLRGSDIEFNPVFFAYAVVRAQGASLYVEASRLTEEAARALQGVVTVHPYEEFLPALARDAGSGDGEGGGSYGAWIAPGCSEAVRQALGSLKVLREVTPVGHLKAVKNEAELRGMRDCHARDAVALAEFFMWLENQVGSGAAVDEVGAAERLLALRAEQEHFVSASFATIAGSGPNGSVIHYHATRAAGCRTLAANEMFLCDSGGQFFDGTTDVTRTVHFGTPTPRERECFTLVLQGHIGLSSAVFPDDTPGILLDSFARRPLWNRGLDYKHGTGHGVGSFLNVHEGPISISKRKPAADHGLRTGMVVSVEPGFYPEGEFGIRIENLVEVAPAVEAGFLTFRPLTLFPLQRSLIDATMLAPHEVAWVDQYHARCLEVVGPLLAEQGRSEALAWFERNTQPLPRP